MQRRKALRVGAVFLSASMLGLYVLKPKKRGQNYSPYFNDLNLALKNYKRSIPSLVVDLDIVDENIEALKTIMPKDADYRIVVKSLPSKELVEYVMKKYPTNKLMVFHQPFLTDISYHGNEHLDILIGKPFPANTFEYYLNSLNPENELFNADNQVQWLIDTEHRLLEYLEISKKLERKIKISIEIDVGLRRGGVNNTNDLDKIFKIIDSQPEHLVFAGFMGYDAHIVKVPSILKSREKAYEESQDFYKKCIDFAKDNYPQLWHENLTLNGAGSPTVLLHQQYGTVINDLAAGSCLVKPTDFDIDTLESMQAASFITTPILKKQEGSKLPSIEKFDGLITKWNPNWKYSYFLYGGAWMANYHEPKGVEGNPIFGKSTNQIMINTSDKIDLEVGDFVFLRPHQSEFVFLQFGEILAFRYKNIFQAWNLLHQSI